MPTSITVAYDAARRRAVLNFASGRKLTLANVTEDQAREFAERHAPEFERREHKHYTGGQISARRVRK